MPVKINISSKGKTHKLETEIELAGKKLGEKIKGEEISQELGGYELEITGASDSSGFPYMKEIEGQGKIRILLKKGKGMKDSRKGIRLKKTVRGNILSQATAQLNLKVIKEGSKKFEELVKKEGSQEQKAEVKEETKEKKEEKDNTSQ